LKNGPTNQAPVCTGSFVMAAMSGTSAGTSATSASMSASMRGVAPMFSAGKRSV